MDGKTWKPSHRKYGIAILNFKSPCKESLCLTVGDAVHIVEEYGSGQTGWFRGHLHSNRNQMGIFPMKYIHTKDFEVENAGQFETVTSSEDCMAKELTFTLREWWMEWKKLYHNECRTIMLEQIYSTMNDLILMRGKLLSNMLTDDSMIDLKEEIAGIVDWGNGQLGMDLIPRVDGKQVDVEKCSIVKLYRVHQQSAYNARSLQPSFRSKALSRNWPPRKQSLAQAERGSKDNVDLFNVLVSFKSSQCNVGDESQIIMSVYDSRNQKFISEQYEIKMNRHGAPVKAEKVNNCFSLFTELPLDSYEKHLYIVIRIYRIGRMFANSTGKTQLRRPFGIGVLSIVDVRNSLKDDSYLCTVGITSCADNEGNFAELHKDVIRKQANQGLGSSINYNAGSLKGSSTTPTRPGTAAGMSLTVDVSIFDGDLQAVKTEQPLLFQKDVTIVPKLSQFDIINPGEVRNDIYLTLMEGVFERGSKKAQKNIEVDVTIFNSDGSMIEKCICYGCGEEPATHFSSSVGYHDNNPKWQETVKISLPMNHLPGSHIRFDVYHCQARNRAVKKLYGFGFMKVTNDLQIVIKDGAHQLCLFKCNEEKKIKFEKYSRLCFLVEDYGDPSKQPIQQSPTIVSHYERLKDYLVVHTLLCSTKFTQTTELLGVLSWRDERKQIGENLDKLMTVQGTEIMKFLQNIMDRLLEMLDDGCSTNAPYSSKVFQVIVFMMNLLLDVRFENFRPVYEDYLLKSFSFPKVYIHLMDQFSAGITMFCAGKPFTLSMAMKVLGELMRLITRSRQLEKNSPFYLKESDIDFKKRLQQIFEKMGKLLSIQEDRLKISQMELLSNLHKCYVPLMELITKRELADHVRDVIIQLPKAKDLVVEIRRTKMEFIQNTVNSDLFKDDESRGTLLPLCLDHIKACLIERYFLDIEIAISILGDILEILFNLKERKRISPQLKTKSITQDINTLALSLFAVLIQSISRMADGDLSHQQSHSQIYQQVMPEEDQSKKLPAKPRRLTIELLVPPRSQSVPSSDELQPNCGEMVACLIELLRLMEESHYTAIIQIYPKGRPLKDFLTLVLHTFQELIRPEMLSSDWTIMRMETNNVIFSAVEYFSQALQIEFLAGECFDQHLWNLYFNLAVEFIVQPSLQLEEYTESKRNKFIERYHDMRVMMGHQIQTLWEKLGSNRRHFIPSMIGPFLKVTLVPERELRVATLPIFYDMIQCEQNTSGNFVMVEKELIEKLDMFITMENQGDHEYKQLFHSILLERVQSEPALKDTGSQFIVSVTNLLEKLLDYKQVYDGEENRDKRMQCTFSILNFYRDNKDKRREMYTQYIKKLYDLHCMSRNYVEAGLSLQLYVQLLEWKNDDIHSEMGFPPEPQCERKEKLLLEIIDCFDKGKIWEYGIPVCKDLAAYYESQLMYRKLSKILQRQASFFTKILDGVELPNDGLDLPKYYPRQEPTYFKVAYYGMSFPPFVQNKAFIYRGGECLKLQDIINQLTQEFPGAEILKSNNPMEENKMSGEAKYIQICAVKPIPDPKNSFADEQKVPREVEKFFKNNDVDTFQFDRSFHQGKRDPDNDFKTLCTERTIMKTNHKFPGILQWYEVIQSDTSTFSPVSTAMNAVNSACKELEVSIETCRRSCSDNNMKDLSRQLNGMITAQVMGGIPKYKEAFFTEEFRSLRPEELGSVQTLKDKIYLQINLLEQGLNIMKKDNSDNLANMVQSLDEQLRKLMKQIGYHKEKKTIFRNPISGICSFTDPRPVTPSSELSSEGSRSSIISETRSTEEPVAIINLTPTQPSPVTPVIPAVGEETTTRVSHVPVKPGKPPKPKPPIPGNKPVPEGKPPQLPVKKTSTEPQTFKSGDGFSVVKTDVPPLPPRSRPSFRESVLPTEETNGNEPRTPLQRMYRLSNSSGETEFSPGSKFETPPIIPSHSTPRVPKIPQGSTSTVCDTSINSSYDISGLSVLKDKTTHNGNVPVIPVSRTSTKTESTSDEIRNGPPPIPARTSRLSNISQTSNSSHESANFDSSDL